MRKSLIFVFLVPNLNDSDMPALVYGNGKTSTTTISTIAVQSGKARIVIALLQAGSKMSFKVNILKYIHSGCKPEILDFYIKYPILSLFEMINRSSMLSPKWLTWGVVFKKLQIYKLLILIYYKSCNQNKVRWKTF